MNKVILIGRLTRDPDVRYSTQGDQQMCVARYTIAVDRRGQRQDGQQTADFISCVAFNRNAEFAEKYLRKGMKIAIEGRIQTGSYTNRDGNKVYTTDVVVEHHEFCESKSQGSGSGSSSYAPGYDSSPAYGQTDSDGFMHIPDNLDDDSLPFN